MSTRFSLSMEMSRLTRDGTAEPVSRDQILRHARGQGNIIFPVQLTTSRIGNLARLIHTLLYVMTIHTYIHTWPSGSSQICIISRNIFILLLILMVGSRIHYSSFTSYIMCHYYIKKSYGPTERGIVTLTLTAAVATSVTSLHEAPRESPGRHRFPTYASNVAFHEMSSTAPMKYYCFLSTYI